MVNRSVTPTRRRRGKLVKEDPTVFSVIRSEMYDAAEVSQYPASYSATEPLTAPHTVTVLTATVALMFYAAFSDAETPTDFNILYGLLAASFFVTVFCAEHLRDTLMLRPHPAFWRWVLGLGLLYAIAMAFALFQNVHDLRQWVRYLDPTTIKGTNPLAEKSYGEDCSFTWSNLVGTMDEFVLAHALGWFAKALMFRDIWLALAASFLFEMLEYTFEAYLPNFIECWWDHLLLDFLGCNALGLVAGHLTMQYLNTKEYNWPGIRHIGSLGQAVRRGVAQFTPYSWTNFKWEIFTDFKRFMVILFLLVVTMQCEMNAFFLKALLWIPPPSKLNVLRLILYWLIGCVGFRDAYHFMTDPRVVRLGTGGWIGLSMVSLEALVVFKFGRAEFADKHLPQPVIVSWVLALGLGLGVALWWFAVRLPQLKQQARTQAVAAAAASTLTAPPTPAAEQAESSPAKAQLPSRSSSRSRSRARRPKQQ